MKAKVELLQKTGKKILLLTNSLGGIDPNELDTAYQEDGKEQKQIKIISTEDFKIYDSATEFKIDKNLTDNYGSFIEELCQVTGKELTDSLIKHMKANVKIDKLTSKPALNSKLVEIKKEFKSTSTIQTKPPASEYKHFSSDLRIENKQSKNKEQRKSWILDRGGNETVASFLNHCYKHPDFSLLINKIEELRKPKKCPQMFTFAQVSVRSVDYIVCTISSNIPPSKVGEEIPWKQKVSELGTLLLLLANQFNLDNESSLIIPVRARSQDFNYLIHNLTEEEHGKEPRVDKMCGEQGVISTLAKIKLLLNNLDSRAPVEVKASRSYRLNTRPKMTKEQDNKDDITVTQGDKDIILTYTEYCEDCVSYEPGYRCLTQFTTKSSENSTLSPIGTGPEAQIVFKITDRFNEKQNEEQIHKAYTECMKAIVQELKDVSSFAKSHGENLVGAPLPLLKCYLKESKNLMQKIINAAIVAKTEILDDDDLVFQTKIVEENSIDTFISSVKEIESQYQNIVTELSKLLKEAKTSLLHTKNPNSMFHIKTKEKQTLTDEKSVITTLVGPEQ